MRSEELTLTLAERLLLYNQYQILSKLDSDAEEGHYEHLADIVQSGYASDYSELVEWFSDEVPAAETEYAKDVLQMFRIMKNAYEKLGEDKQGITEEDLTFRGFDGHSESHLMGYVAHLQKSKRVWRESLAEPFDVDSHGGEQDYRAMLREFEASKDKHHLTADDLKRIISRA